MMALIAGVIAMPAMRARVAGIAGQAVTGELDSLLSYRPVPWAAVEMIPRASAARLWTGHLRGGVRPSSLERRNLLEPPPG
jgi:hypothetical protein